MFLIYIQPKTIDWWHKFFVFSFILSTSFPRILRHTDYLWQRMIHATRNVGENKINDRERKRRKRRTFYGKALQNTRQKKKKCVRLVCDFNLKLNIHGTFSSFDLNIMLIMIWIIHGAQHVMLMTDRDRELEINDWSEEIGVAVGGLAGSFSSDRTLSHNTYGTGWMAGWLVSAPLHYDARATVHPIFVLFLVTMCN